MIFRNVKYSVGVQNIDESLAADKMTIYNILKQLSINIEENTFSVKRFGLQSDNHVRPICATFANKYIARNIYAKRDNLKDGVKILADRTEIERNFLKETITELNDYNQKNQQNPKKLKYINGTPTLIFVNKQQNEKK